MRLKVSFDRECFGWIWVWQERRATPGFPWHRSFDAVGLEPAVRGIQPGAELGPVAVPGFGSVSSELALEVAPIGRTPGS